MSVEENKAPEDIEGEIEQTRSEMRETLDAIQNKLTPGQMMDEVMSYIHRGPGQFAVNLGRVARGNPVPVALVGVGLAWLAMSRARSGSENEEDYDETRYYYASAGGGDYAAAAAAAYPAHGDAVAGDGDAYSTVGAAHVAGVGAEPSHGSGSSVGGSRPHQHGSMEGWREPDRADHMIEGAREMTESSRDRLSRIGGMAREQGRRARTGLGEMIEEQPLLMAAAAFVLGAALGVLLPSTRRENRWVGETRDEFAQRAASYGREGLRRAEHVAEETWTAVSDEVLNRGDPSPAERKAEHMTERMGESSSRRSGSTSGDRTGTGAGTGTKPVGAAGSTPGPDIPPSKKS